MDIGYVMRARKKKGFPGCEGGGGWDGSLMGNSPSWRWIVPLFGAGQYGEIRVNSGSRLVEDMGNRDLEAARDGDAMGDGSRSRRRCRCRR